MRNFLPNLLFGNRRDNDLIGSVGDDLVFGYAGNGRIETKAGNDFVIAGKGNDLIDTGAGDDFVLAGKGDDVVRTGAGDDIAFGGKGFDTAVFDEGINAYDIDISDNGKLVIVSSATASDGGRDHLRQFEALFFTGDDYTLFLDGTNNAVLAGDDTAETGETEVLTLQVADLLANDQEFDGDAVGLISVSTTSSAGTTVTLSDGMVSYDPGTRFAGLAAGAMATDTFTYVVGDGRGGNDTATVTVTLIGEDNPPRIDARINEIHYDNEGIDTGEFVEIRVAARDDVSTLAIELLNGSGGTVYNSTDVAGLPMTSDGAWDYFVWSLPSNGIQNGAPDGLALVNAGNVVEFLSYEGTFTATSGAAAGLTSTDIGVAEAAATPAGQSLQRNEDGSWSGPAEETPGAANEGDDGGDGETQKLFISQVQGPGFASPYETMNVTVDAIVTYTRSTGFYLQEEDTEADGDMTTSEGIFVFTGGGALPSLGDRVSVTGTVTEFFGETQIASPEVTIVSGGNPMPTPAQLLLGPYATTAEKEAIEGMYFELMSGTVDPITVITNFNFDRFGEIYVSAGNQYQPTQLYDAQMQAAEVQALLEVNLANRLKIDDGSSMQNPTEFAYVANTGPGDNGNGILDAGDRFTAEGPTLRLGSEFDGPARGVMTYAFGDYTMLVDGTLPIDPATNEGARQAMPDDVGGTLQVGAFNVLNYFTTLSGSTVGPDNLAPRGATTTSDLDRQTTKIVEAMTASGIDVFALQEIENNGFGPGSASATLAGELSTATGEAFAVVDPTGGAPYLGSDAISNAILYDTGKVTLTGSASLVFAEDSAATTFALADALAGLIGGSSAVGDFQRNRPAIVATFEEQESGEAFTVASVHFKSKGASGLDTLVGQAESYLSANAGTLTPGEVDAIDAAIADLTGDPNYDQGDGQGFWNAVRTDAAGELYSFLSTTYEGGVETYVILGDFNAYTQEDPTQAIGDQTDTVDLLAEYVGADAYSFVFDGQRGALDQAMASTGFADHVTGLAEWHINADEPDLLSYSSEFNDPRFYSPDVFASSDHDPVILGLDFGDTPML